MTLTKEQAQWLIGAIDLRVKNEGLIGAAPGLAIAAMIQAEHQAEIPDDKDKDTLN